MIINLDAHFIREIQLVQDDLGSSESTITYIILTDKDGDYSRLAAFSTNSPEQIAIKIVPSLAATERGEAEYRSWGRNN